RLAAACTAAIDEFLADYSFSPMDSHETSIDVRVDFLGQYVGLIFHYEKREAWLQALIGTNENGHVAEPPCGEITPTTQIRCFDIDDLKRLRTSPDAVQSSVSHLPEE